MQSCPRPAGCFRESPVKAGGLHGPWGCEIKSVPPAQEHCSGPGGVRGEIQGSLNKQVPVRGRVLGPQYVAK